MNKVQQIFVLMRIAKMTVTEINTLTDSERETLANWFLEANDNDNKEKSKHT